MQLYLDNLERAHDEIGHGHHIHECDSQWTVHHAARQWPVLVALEL